jgi:pimeloyl-ACP methyl ester carboxylesterase
MKEFSGRKGQEKRSLRRAFKASSVGDLTPPAGRLYTVEGRNLALHREGSGNPPVVFLPGAGLVGLDFLNIHEQVSQFTTSVLYDRAGTGWSDQVKLPRSATEVTDELRGLLRKATIPAPYLLVGHSLGGAYARRYAQRFPAEVAGLLLMEPFHEDYDAYMPKQTTFERLRVMLALLRWSLHSKAFYRSMYGKMLATWPDEVREPLIDWHLRASMKHLQELPASQRTGKGFLSTELRNGGNMPDVPLIVLSALGVDPPTAVIMPESYRPKMNDGKRALFTALASSVAHGEYREVENAGHSTMHTDRPDAVVQVIRDLVESIQHGPPTAHG